VSEDIRRLIDEAYSDRATDRAKAYDGYAAAAAAARAARDEALLAHALRHLSDMDREDGRAEQALSFAEEAVQLYRRDPSSGPLDLANALRLAALASMDSGCAGASGSLWREARDLYQAAEVEPGVREADGHLHDEPEVR
jgi:hypothetical protein